MNHRMNFWLLRSCYLCWIKFLKYKNSPINARIVQHHVFLNFLQQILYLKQKAMCIIWIFCSLIYIEVVECKSELFAIPVHVKSRTIHLMKQQLWGKTLCDLHGSDLCEILLEPHNEIEIMQVKGNTTKYIYRLSTFSDFARHNEPLHMRISMTYTVNQWLVAMLFGPYPVCEWYLAWTTQYNEL